MMKKLFVIAFAAAMLLVLAACNKEQNVMGTTGTTPSTEEFHTHNYVSVETPASCTENGKEVFTCACGDTSTLEIPATGHAWGEWEIETPALIGKNGVEKQACMSCGKVDTRESTQDALQNSFGDYELQYLIQRWNGVNGNITADAMLAYFSQKYEGREADPMVVSSAEVFQWLSERFVLTDALKEEMKRSQDSTLRYNEATDTFELDFAGSCGDAQLMGYIYNGGKSYMVYYQYTSWYGDSRVEGIWEVAMEYNLLNGAPNKILSATKVNAIPDKVVS